jgi:hypothetical protein
MAIISIPTSIGGINIPGGIFGGPLSDLDEVGGTFSYKYPRDLESSTKAHVVNFTIQEVTEVELKTLTNDAQAIVTNIFDGTAGQAALNGASEVYGKLEDVGAAVWSTITNSDGASDVAKNLINQGIGGTESVITSLADTYETLGKYLTQQKTKNIGQISLYMPEAFNVTSAATYDDSISVASALGSIPLLGKLIKTGTNIAEGAGNEAFKVALNRAGYVFNPQKQVLFQGIEFRHFSMSFTFTPYSQAEAEQIRQIIEKFRMYAAPKKNTSVGKGMFWVPPAIFQIDFRMNGTHNKHLPKLQNCVINSIDVNYAPNGWTTHTDGAPVQTTLTLEFQEIALVGRDEISQGY